MKQFLQAILLGVFSDAFKFGTEPVEVPVEVESLNFSLANTRFDLALALPVVLVNLSNYTGLIMHHNEAITSDVTHHFGDLLADLELLYDKVEGFYTILHQHMGADGPLYCPKRHAGTIRECISVAMCLLQSAVPVHVPLYVYASYLEQVARFDDLTATLLQMSLMQEENSTAMNEPLMPIPEEYVCSSDEDVDLALLQYQTSTMATSVAFRKALTSSHRILNEHESNSSMVHTEQQLESAWQPVCHLMGCDHTRFWDVYFSSHEHSTSLLDSSLPRAAVLTALKAEVTSRVKLENKMQRFVRVYQSAFFGFFNGHKDVSEKSFHGYHERNKQATHGFVASAMKSVAELDAAHAMSILGTELFVKYAQSVQTSANLGGRRRRRKGFGKWAKKKAKQTKSVAKKGIDAAETHVVDNAVKYGQKAVDAVKNMDAGVPAEVWNKIPGPIKDDLEKYAAKAWDAIPDELINVIMSLLRCFGSTNVFGGAGYSVTSGPVSGTIGLAVGASWVNKMQWKDLIGMDPAKVAQHLAGKPMPDDTFVIPFKALIEGQKFPSVWLSLFISLTIGPSVGKGAGLWGGVSFAASVSCGVDTKTMHSNSDDSDLTQNSLFRPDKYGSCSGTLSASVSSTGWVSLAKQKDPIPPCPAGGQLGPSTCSVYAGASLTVMCCWMDFITKANNCR
ncbi:unnamed protein product [Durusdinium trenchii]|uniref:Uncharacterized protein n=2 Tax=Durusdinium trenchii TaxID=1381693 RepID=A0ABP0HCL7_9DINO